MEILKIILGVLGVVAAIVFGGLFSGVLIWLIWPICIPATFPGLVSAGYLAAKLTLWQSFCLSWLFGLLIKSTQTNNNKVGK